MLFYDFSSLWKRSAANGLSLRFSCEQILVPPYVLAEELISNEFHWSKHSPKAFERESDTCDSSIGHQV